MDPNSQKALPVTLKRSKSKRGKNGGKEEGGVAAVSAATAPAEAAGATKAPAAPASPDVVSAAAPAAASERPASASSRKRLSTTDSLVNSDDHRYRYSAQMEKVSTRVKNKYLGEIKGVDTQGN